MNRKKKYRAWDEEKEILMYNHEGETDGAGHFEYSQILPVPDDNDFFFIYQSKTDSSYQHIEMRAGSVMQYIGRQDKHGDEVYEGDIVFEGGHFGIIEWDEEYSKYVMKTNQAHLGLYLFSGEVVGNIYENPELLEKESS